jgi:Zn-dependent M28 family amino/carboxypeptidase
MPRDDICNGAVDNATGVAALAALAKMNRAAGPAQRSEVFLAVTLEESGLLGSNTTRATRSIRWRRPWAA